MKAVSATPGRCTPNYKRAAAKKKKNCDKKALRKQWLEDLVVNETMKLVEDDASIINAIYLYDDKVLIAFCYKEGTETVAFGEAVKAEKSSDISARGAPNFERQIVRFGVLSLCRKAAAHFLHTVCTFARIKGFSAQGLHSLLSSA